MSFADGWKTSSQSAGGEYYKLRFDEIEISNFRRGILNASAKDKFEKRLKRQNKIVSVIAGGCFGVMILLFVPLICFFGYNFYKQPQSRLITGLIFGAMFVLFIFAIILLVFKLINYQKNIKADLKTTQVNCEQGQLKIEIISGGKSTMRKSFSINNVKFEIIEDAIGDEINKQFLSPIITVADSRVTTESYAFYYLPQSKLVLYYEPA